MKCVMKGGRTREALRVDCPQQAIKPNTVLGELRKVLIDHVECWVEYCVENGRYLRS
jgi:hypothetical protein